MFCLSSTKYRTILQWKFCANNKLGRLQPKPIGQRIRKLLAMYYKLYNYIMQRPKEDKIKDRLEINIGI
jgi:hypothetical protein